MILLTLYLTGCTAVLSSAPALVLYSNEEQTQAAKELNEDVKLGHIMVPRMIIDYGKLRDMVRSMHE